MVLMNFKALLLSLFVVLPAWASSPIFKSQPLSASYQKKLKQQHLWHIGCPVPLSRLRDVHVSYYDFQGKVHTDGHLVVMDVIAKDTLAVFKALYQRRFPFQSIRPSSDFEGDDAKSMAANNTSAFNCRPVTGGKRASLHAYGLAIDINTLQNPFIRKAKNKKTIVLPPKGQAYLDRANQRPGMAEPIVALFKTHGFAIWGGQWHNPIDYQHFQVTRAFAQVLAQLPAQEAQVLYEFAHERSAQQ